MLKENIFLDDILRLFLPEIFYGYNIHEAYSVKLTRDAELYIEDEFAGNLLDKIKRSLSKRGAGVPCRFQYDRAMPASLLKFLKVKRRSTKSAMMKFGLNL